MSHSDDDLFDAFILSDMGWPGAIIALIILLVVIFVVWPSERSFKEKCTDQGGTTLYQENNDQVCIKDGIHLAIKP